MSSKGPRTACRSTDRAVRGPGTNGKGCCRPLSWDTGNDATIERMDPGRPFGVSKPQLGADRRRSPIMSPLAFLHAWMLCTMLAAFATGIVIVPASVLGFRVRTSEAVEAVFWVALGFLLLAEVVAAAK